MRFEVSLSSKIQSVFITEFIPARIVRIMAGTNRIDVQLFHDSDILNHALYTYHISTIRIYLMPVGTLNQYRLAVHQQLGVLDFHIAEAHLLRNHLRYPLLILQRDVYLI